MHKSRNKWGAYKQTTFLANMNLALLKSHSVEQLHKQDAKKAPSSHGSGTKG